MLVEIDPLGRFTEGDPCGSRKMTESVTTALLDSRQNPTELAKGFAAHLTLRIF